MQRFDVTSDLSAHVGTETGAPDFRLDFEALVEARIVRRKLHDDVDSTRTAVAHLFCLYVVAAVAPVVGDLVACQRSVGVVRDALRNSGALAYRTRRDRIDARLYTDAIALEQRLQSVGEATAACPRAGGRFPLLDENRVLDQELFALLRPALAGGP